MRTISAVAAISAIVLVATGCGGADGGSESAAQTTGRGAAVGEPAPGTTPPAEDGDPIAAARDSRVGGHPVRLQIVQLERSGATTALTFRLSITEQPAPDAGDPRAQISDTFADGIRSSVETGIDTLHSLDGVSLIDAQNRKRYLVARDSRGFCVCDVDLSSAFVSFDAPLLLSATFGAPPDDVDAVDVAIPRFGTFKNVPLS